ncbi:MAG: hypothetical protein HAW59_05420 [Betaproteobacteria bacterium]|nr:hypothetical protein [Betaproteobacteria bacterium]
MHYAGTYAIAKLAGLTDEAARQIGNSAQFVDDAAEDIAVMFEDTGHFYASEISARHCGTAEYLKESRVYMKSYVDQLNIWVPFHFLPGNNGESLTQKLVCQPDSEIAKEMIQSHVNHACQLREDGKPWGNYLVGVAAHVYADTFAHYGFSGVSSRRNLVDGSSIKEYEGAPEENKSLQALAEKEKSKWGILPNFRQMIRSHLGEQATDIDGGTMGHPGVGKLPDLPYLVYEFQYERGELLHGGQPTSPRNNPKTYLEACKKMHAYFSRYAESSNQKDENSYREFSSAEREIAQILSHRVKEAKSRLKHWQQKAEEFWGLTIPDYEGDSWKEIFQESKTSDEVLASDAYRFYRASAYHKMVVLDQVLPKYGINLECRQFRAGSYS